jgi:hypothetical protein
LKELNGGAQYHQGRAADLARGDGVGGDLFGESTATSGNGAVTVVGSAEHDSSGAVYVFTDQNGTWTQIAELFVPATAELGTSLALSSDTSTIVLAANVRLVTALRKTGATINEADLATGMANSGLFNAFLASGPETARRYKYGREADGSPSRPWGGKA